MTASEARQAETRRSPFLVAVWFAILTVPAAVAAYYRIFSGFSEWDDEGTQMMTVWQYLSGARLYEQIYSGYGPVYFFYNWMVRALTGNVLNHDAVRITSAVVSLVCSLVCAWIVLRLTNSLAAASITHLLAFRSLQFFVNEPGHPQELCMLLLVCLVATAIVASNPAYRGIAMAAAGCLVAALMLVKVNIGIFAILALAIAALVQSTAVRYLRPVMYAVFAGTLLTPFALMRIHLHDPAAQAYCFVVTASIAGVLTTLPAFGKTSSLSARQLLAPVAGFSIAFALTLVTLGWQRVPMTGALDMLVLSHVRLNVSQGFWYRPVELPRMWMVWAALGLVAAIVVRRAIRYADEGIFQKLAPFQLVFGAASILFAVSMPNLLLGFVTPMYWLLLFAPPAPGMPRQIHARILLCTLGVLQTLYAYPIAGSQTYFLRILLALAGPISLIDGVRGLSQPVDLATIARRIARPAALATMALVALAYPLLAYRARSLYTSLTPLNLPGAERLRVEAQEARDYQQLVAFLRQNCDTFVGLPGIPSLYFWAGKPLPGNIHQPPGQLNFGQWMDMFSGPQQQAIVDDFSRHPNACAVYHPSGLNFWNTGKQDVRKWPLANYILTEFKTIGQTGDYQFMIPKARQLTTSAELPHQ
jgi:hypothetical protein